MKKTCLSLFALLYALVLNPDIAKAQNPPGAASVNIRGEVTNPISMTADQLHQFEQTKVVRKDKDGNDHTYSGVMLATILQKAGATMGKELKGENLTKYAVIEASDGYHVVFALAELDQAFTDRKIILADQADGKPLPLADGPFRIIVQDEKRPARCIKQVTSITVRFAK